MQAILNALRTRLLRPYTPHAGGIVLVQRRIFILPTRAGVAFALILMLMEIGTLTGILGTARGADPIDDVASRCRRFHHRFCFVALAEPRHGRAAQPLVGRIRYVDVQQHGSVERR